MIEITQRQWELVPKAYKGHWQDIAGQRPDYIGRKVLFTVIERGGLPRMFMAVEGINFQIVPDKTKETQPLSFPDIVEPVMIKNGNFNG